MIKETNFSVKIKRRQILKYFRTSISQKMQWTLQLWKVNVQNLIGGYYWNLRHSIEESLNNKIVPPFIELLLCSRKNRVQSSKRGFETMRRVQRWISFERSPNYLNASTIFLLKQWLSDDVCLIKIRSANSVH